MAVVDLDLTPQSKALVAEVKKCGALLDSRAVIRQGLPSPRWWQIISTGAKSPDPMAAAISALSVLIQAEPDQRPWPEGLYEHDKSLPPISPEEAIAILGQFLLADVGKIRAGFQVYPLHWDVLGAHYCPLRERYASLRELVRTELLVQSVGESMRHESQLQWPLTITDQCVKRIHQLRLDAKLPTLRKLEDGLHRLTEAYPILTTKVPWAVIGGLAVKAFEWIVAALK